VIKTKGAYGQTFGGYSEQSWKPSGGWVQEYQILVFSIKKDQAWRISEYQKDSMWYSPNYGPRYRDDLRLGSDFRNKNDNYFQYLDYRMEKDIKNKNNPLGYFEAGEVEVF